MRYVINRQVVLSRAPDGPLAAYIRRVCKISQSAQGIPRIRFTGRFCSLRASATGSNKRDSHCATSVPIIPRSICVIVLGGCGLQQAICAHSGTSLIFCAVRA